MRTTVEIDDDVLEAAKRLAAGRKISLGKALSDLARRGTRVPLVNRNGVYVLSVERNVPRFGSEEVQAALESEDRDHAAFFQKPKS